ISHEFEIAGWVAARPGLNQVGLAFPSIMDGIVAGVGAGMRFKLVLRSRCPVRVLLTSTVVATAIVLAGCTSDGTPPLPGNAGSIGSFIRNLLGPKSEDQPPVAQNEAPVEPSVPKAKSATSKPKQGAGRRITAHLPVIVDRLDRALRVSAFDSPRAGCQCHG